MIEISLFEQDGMEGERVSSVAVFKDKLFVAEVFANPLQEKDLIRISRYTFSDSLWQEVYHSFMTRDRWQDVSTQQNPENNPVGDISEEKEKFKSPSSHIVIAPQCIGMSECLYIRFVTSIQTCLLCSENGNDFRSVEVAPAYIGALFSSHKFLAFQDYLYTLPPVSSSQTFQEENHIAIQVYAPEEVPQWRATHPLDFGDQSNLAVSELVVFKNSLYAATLNTEKGFQVWGLENSDSRALNWQPILIDGAYRYALNQQVTKMLPFKGELYIASGLQLKKGKEHENKSYPAGFEILRIYPDGDWDIIIGNPKFTQDGLKVPLSAQGSGFNDPYSCFIECFDTAQGYLYLGTQSLEGFQLWRSQDGESWELLPLSEELGRNYQVTVQNTMPTSWGLVFSMNTVESNGSKKLRIWLFN
ncbi:MAG: hypothetical protein AAGE59_05205 [Cyanobacteria bacterium P01_F01_bin.86]